MTTIKAVIARYRGNMEAAGLIRQAEVRKKVFGIK
jgi:hypothetical protein